jgi:hypothetical protein
MLRQDTGGVDLDPSLTAWGTQAIPRKESTRLASLFTQLLALSRQLHSVAMHLVLRLATDQTSGAKRITVFETALVRHAPELHRQRVEVVRACNVCRVLVLLPGQ